MKNSFQLFILIILAVFFPLIGQAAESSLYLAPAQGTFFSAGTFSVSVYLNTKGEEINAVQVDLKFPPELLQVTLPTAGESFVSEWLTPPSYSNTGGVISFKGGIPGGIITSSGLISTITFRAKSPGLAKVEFLDSSQVFLNDGKGTPVFSLLTGGSYRILVPPPEGPEISSANFSDPGIWYCDSSPSFSWEKKTGVNDFSWNFSQNPQENPDTVSEGIQTMKAYEEVSDGVWYFHLRAKESSWGRASHRAVKIDCSPPEKFDVQIDTNSGYAYFETKDHYSGIDYYEVSIFTSDAESAGFYIEAISPFKVSCDKPGKYKIIVRAYDKAGNRQEIETEFQILSSFISYIPGQGIQIKGVFLPWWLIYLIMFFLFLGLGYLIFCFSKRGKLGFRKGIKEIKEALREIEKIEQRETEINRLKANFKDKKQELEKKLNKEKNEK